MSRYIDADKLWDDRPLIPEGKSQDYGAGFSECMWGFSKRIREQIDHTADVVEVVRCRDCRYFTEGMAVGMCKRIEGKPLIPVVYNHFCSYGVRREE